MIRSLVFLPPELLAAMGEFGVCINSSIPFKGQQNLLHNLYNIEIVAPHKQLELKTKNRFHLQVAK
jgi:hypothetical protein